MAQGAPLDGLTVQAEPMGVDRRHVERVLVVGFDAEAGQRILQRIPSAA